MLKKNQFQAMSNDLILNGDWSSKKLFLSYQFRTRGQGITEIFKTMMISETNE